MKKILLLSVALIAITVSLAAAGTNQLTLRNSDGQVISSADFDPRSMSYDDGNCLQMRTIAGKTEIAFVLSTSLHQEGAKDHTIERPDLSDLQVGLGVNYYVGNKPVLKDHKTSPVICRVSRDNPDVAMTDPLELPLDGSIIALTIPVRVKVGGQFVGRWNDPDSHAWSWINWYNSACGRYGDGQIAYLVRYVNGRWEAVGKASPPGASDAVPMSNRN